MVICLSLTCSISVNTPFVASNNCPTSYSVIALSQGVSIIFEIKILKSINSIVMIGASPTHTSISSKSRRKGKEILCSKGRDKEVGRVAANSTVSALEQESKEYLLSATIVSLLKIKSFSSSE